MKQENLYKIGIGIFALWEIYYSYWFFKIHKEIIRPITYISIKDE